jgi:hypothetical protein
VAGGKLLLDTRDAINRDTGANNSLIYGDIDSKAEHSVSYAFNASQQGQRPVPQSDLLPAGTAILSGPSVSTGTAAGKPDDLIETFCREPHPSALTFQHCKANYELLRRKDASINQLIRWVPPLIRVNTSATSGQMDQQAKDQINEEIVQSVTAWFGTIGNYFLPLLYGGLGTLCFVLRQFDGYIARRVLTNRTNHEIQNRLILGLITGSCIGIFINAMPGAAQATGVSAAAVTLTASAWAFIAGYNVEFLFKIIDALMHHVTAAKPPLDDPAPAPRQ